jgi:cation diffusion facilitator CzcD-associated flavoprotein CzcO
VSHAVDIAQRTATWCAGQRLAAAKRHLVALVRSDLARVTALAADSKADALTRRALYHAADALADRLADITRPAQ